MRKNKVISSGRIKVGIKPICPHCKADADGLTGLSDITEMDRRPKDGSITICAYCSTVSTIKLVKATMGFELVQIPDYEVAIMQATDENFRFLLLHVKDRIKNRK
jgi:hypothetical protein